MFKFIATATGIVGSALLLSACSSTGTDSGTSAPSQHSPQIVTSQESCQKVTLQQGQPLIVRFDSNPSTGFQWSLLQESSVLQLERSQFIAPQNDGNNPPMVGAPGMHEWLFTPRQKGTDTLIFTYQQPWERTSYRKIECRVSVE